MQSEEITFTLFFALVSSDHTISVPQAPFAIRGDNYVTKIESWSIAHLLSVNVRELQIKADAMHVQLRSQKSCETLEQTQEVLVDVCVDHEQLLKESTNAVIEDIDNIV